MPCVFDVVIRRVIALPLRQIRAQNPLRFGRRLQALDGGNKRLRPGLEAKLLVYRLREANGVGFQHRGPRPLEVAVGTTGERLIGEPSPRLGHPRLADATVGDCGHVFGVLVQHCRHACRPIAIVGQRQEY